MQKFSGKILGVKVLLKFYQLTSYKTSLAKKYVKIQWKILGVKVLLKPYQSNTYKKSPAKNRQNVGEKIFFWGESRAKSL